MDKYQYDIVVIGSGPSGESAAINAAKSGKKVAIIENNTSVGGNCTHVGTIPSKALRQSVKQILEFNTNPLFREISAPKWFSFPHILKEANKVIQKQINLYTQHFARNGVDVYAGQGMFVDTNTLAIKGTEGIKHLSFVNAIIAVGSSPYKPSDVAFDNSHIFNSDSILQLDRTPKTMIIYGAGVIGSEYASIFAGLGVKVDLINTQDRLLGFLDAEISDALSYHLRSSAVKIRNNESYESVERTSSGVSIKLKSGKTIHGDVFLWANGRSGNTEGLGLDTIGITPNNRKQIPVNEFYQTEVPHVYAVGDVIGWPGLASASFDQGRSATSHLLDLGTFRHIDSVPTGIYTIPEISSLGDTEEQLTEQGVDYEVGYAHFKAIARAHIAREDVGMLKILFDRKTLKILGIHCFGAQASEIIHIGQAIMSQDGEANSLSYFANTTFNYPTMAEAYRVAALSGLARVK